MRSALPGPVRAVVDALANRFADRCICCDMPAARGLCGPCAFASRASSALREIHPRPAGCDRALVLASYEPAGGQRPGRLSPLTACLWRFKYSGDRLVGRRLGRLLAAAASNAGLHCDAVVPIPLSHNRLRQRCFNQAAWLARPVARAIGARFVPLALERTIDTPAQAGRSAAIRRASLAGTFRVRRGYAAGVRDRHIVVVDDVITTGSSVAEAVRALRDAHVGRVTAVALLYAHPRGRNMKSAASK